MPVQPDAAENRAPGLIPEIAPSSSWRVAEVRALPAWRLHVRFNDGVEGEVDLHDLIHGPQAGVFEALRDPTLFAQAGLQWGAVTWPNGLDLAPDGLYGQVK